MFGVLRPPSPAEHAPISPSPSSPSPRSLAPMPPGQFNSREDVLAGANRWGSQQGYAVVIARSRPNRLWIKCDRGGKYENRRKLSPHQRKRNRGESRLLGCPFRILASLKKDGIWRTETDIAEHNHEASEDLSVHPSLRRMSEDQLQKVHELCDAGISPAETIDELRAAWPDIHVLPRDVYNARKKYKTEKAMAEAVQRLRSSNQTQTPEFPDPNGVFPGPSPNGRWAWVPDGQEVTKKKRKRRSIAAQSNLDPQLCTAESSHDAISASSQQDLTNFLGDPKQQSQPSRQPPAASTTTPRPNHSIPSVRRPPSSSSSQLQQPQYQPYTNTPTPTPNPSHPPPPHHTPPTNTSPRTSRSKKTRNPPPPLSTPAATSTTTTTTSPPLPLQTPSAETVIIPDGTARPITDQVLLSRLEIMEKETREAKAMLARILGAVAAEKG